LAFPLGSTLLEFGAVELIHAGSKVASTVSENDPSRLRQWTPREYYLISKENPMKPLRGLKLAFEGGMMPQGPHVSLRSPLDETKSRMYEILSTTVCTTVDLEAAQFCLAAVQHDKPFDALYHVSDYIYRDHEKKIATVSPLIAGKSKSLRTKIWEAMSGTLRFHTSRRRIHYSSVPAAWLPFDEHPKARVSRLYQRHKICEEIESHFNQSNTGRNGRCLVLEGPAGVGKSFNRNTVQRHALNSLWWRGVVDEGTRI
jgi:hypothetical protein